MTRPTPCPPSPSALRLERSLYDTPAAVSVLTRDDTQQGQQRVRLDEALTPVPGLFLQNRDNFAQGQRIASRRDFKQQLPFPGNSLVDYERYYYGGRVGYTRTETLANRPVRYVTCVELGRQEDDRGNGPENALHNVDTASICLAGRALKYLNGMLSEISTITIK